MNSSMEQNTYNYLPLSIISAILGCFSPCFIGVLLGLVSIYFAVKRNTETKKGEFAEAFNSAKYAKTIAYIAIIIAVINMIYIAYLYYSNPEYFQEMYELYREMLEEAQAQ